MKTKDEKEYLSQFFKIKTIEVILNCAINRYETLQDKRMIRKYKEDLKELDFKMEKLLEKYVDIIDEVDYDKAADKYSISEIMTLELTKKYLGIPMTIEQLVIWSQAIDITQGGKI